MPSINDMMEIGYININNDSNDYIDKISVETNSRASLVIIEGEE